MPQLRRIGRVWYSDLYVAGRRVRRALDTDRRIAERKLAELVKERHDARYGPGDRNLAWTTFKDRYFLAARAKAPGTVKRERAAVAALEDYLTPSRLRDVTPARLDEWKGARVAAGKGAATINRDLRAVKMMMRKAEGWNLVTPQPWTGVGQLKEARRKLYFYTEAQLAVLVRRTTGVWRTVALLGALAGLRRGEMYHLTWADVDLKEGTIAVNPKPCPCPGCAPRRGLWAPKDYEARTIPLHADLAAHLAALPRNGPWVLGQRPKDEDVVTAYMRKLAKKLGLDGSVHVLRHTFGSHAAASGVPLPVLKEWMGHEDVRTTMVYAHLVPGRDKEHMARLPRVRLDRL